MAFTNSIDVKTKPAIEERAITIIIIGDIIPADTAASPRISPPSIDIADPVVDDILKSLSLNISKEIIIKNASTMAGKGTAARWAFSSKSRGREIEFWL